MVDFSICCTEWFPFAVLLQCLQFGDVTFHGFSSLFALDFFMTWRGRLPTVKDKGVQERVPALASQVPSRYNIIGKTTAPWSADRKLQLFSVLSLKIWMKITWGASSCVVSH